MVLSTLLLSIHVGYSESTILLEKQSLTDEASFNNKPKSNLLLGNNS